ncbi:glycosyltransferase family 2 protein [Bernardetia sp.]|uniref:glycosyltransferase family 2 protein n=1 Tax=Bernardetia sp. TaxID=1937974 RepID=UPI0025B8FDB8|nr:glycosyltransferase [Bernardetia sp.]
MPKVSVVMPVFNGEKFIKMAIESILNQTYKDFELVIINDGSTDSSAEIIQSYQDERIRFLENEGNRGIFYTRNRLFEEAKGEYIAILDCDDCAEPIRLEKQVAFLDENEEFGLVGSWITIIDNENTIKGAWQLEHRPERIAAKLLFLNQFAQSSIMMRKEFSELKYRKEYPPAEDYDLWIRIAHKTRVINLPESLIKYRIHDNNISQTQRETADRNVLKIYKNQLEELGVYATPDELKTHTKIGNMNFEVNNKVFFEKAKNWLELLHTKNQRIRVYKTLVFNELLGEYWAELLSKNIDLDLAKESFKNSLLSPLLSANKKDSLSKAFRLRSFPLNYTVKPILHFFKKKKNK